MCIDKNKITDYINSFVKKKVLIVGDVMIDSYMWGKVNRISPEAPIPIVSITKRDYRLGGAANVALNLAALGAQPFLCSVVGSDEKGETFQKLLKSNNLTSQGIIIDDSRPTTVKTRIISSGQHLLRVDEEVSDIISETVRKQLFDRIVEIIANQKIDIIVFEDYDKGVLSYDLISSVIKLANQNGIFVTVDPKKRNFNHYQNVNLFKPNLKEFCEGQKIELNKNDLTELKAHALTFLQSNNIEILMITLSELGILIANKTDSFHFPALVRDIVDVSGAGDTVISVASLLLCTGANIGDIAKISNIAGGLVCEKTGVAPIDVNDLANEFE
jgi:rfaE bifunctional protein kinase chain/domain